MFGFKLKTSTSRAGMHSAVALCLLATAGIASNDVRGQCVCCEAGTADFAILQQSDDFPADSLVQWDVDRRDSSPRRILDGFGGGTSASADRNRLFPIGNQMLIDLGYPVPLPFGVGANAMYSDQEFAVEQVQIGVGGLPALPVELVDIPSLQCGSTTGAVRYDFWVPALPQPVWHHRIHVGRDDG